MYLLEVKALARFERMMGFTICQLIELYFFFLLPLSVLIALLYVLIRT